MHKICTFCDNHSQGQFYIDWFYNQLTHFVNWAIRQTRTPFYSIMRSLTVVISWKDCFWSRPGILRNWANRSREFWQRFWLWEFIWRSIWRADNKKLDNWSNWNSRNRIYRYRSRKKSNFWRYRKWNRFKSSLYKPREEIRKPFRDNHRSYSAWK